MYNPSMLAVYQLRSMGHHATADDMGRVYVEAWKSDLSEADHLELSTSQVHELAQTYCADNDIFPRYCSATGNGMWDGYCVNDGDMYFSEEAHLLEHLRKCEQDSSLSDEFLLREAYEADVYYYTDWREIPIEDYDTPPDLTTK